MDEYTLGIKAADPHLTMGGGNMNAQKQIQKLRNKQHS